MGIFLITLFGGMFGLHKFLSGKIGMGLLYLCTLGLFGFGWLYDCFIAFKNIGRPAAMQQPIINIYAAPVPVKGGYPPLSDDYINSLMASHSSYRDTIGPVERDFTRALIYALSDAKITLPLCYDIKGSCVNYRIGAYQIGRIMLIDQHKQIQVLTPKDVQWCDIQGLNDAVSFIPQWVKYALYLQNSSIK